MTFIRKCILTLAVAAVLSVLTIWLDGQLLEYRARRELQVLQTVRVGTTTLAEIEELARRNSGRVRQPCSPALCNVDSPLIVNTLMWKAHLAQPTRFGGGVVIENGVVDQMEVTLDVSRTGPIGLADVWVFPVGEERRILPGDPPFKVMIGRARCRGNNQDGERDVIVHMTPAATPEQQKAAFDFNLSCLSRLGGCRCGAEILPEVLRFEKTP